MWSPHIVFLDADHTGDRATRISYTGVIIFVNKATILWYSKKQNTVGTSTFSSESISLKTATELVKALWCKLWVLGIPIEVPTNMFCDNEAVYKNASTPEFKLKNKNVSICCHNFRESVTGGLARIAKEGTATNLADLFSSIMVQIRRETLVDKFTY